MAYNAGSLTLPQIENAVGLGGLADYLRGVFNGNFKDGRANEGRKMFSNFTLFWASAKKFSNLKSASQTGFGSIKNSAIFLLPNSFLKYRHGCFGKFGRNRLRLLRFARSFSQKYLKSFFFRDLLVRARQDACRGVARANRRRMWLFYGVLSQVVWRGG